MKIGFDAKRAFNNKSGLGNYSRDVIRALMAKPENELFLFTPKQDASVFSLEAFETKEEDPKPVYARFEMIEPEEPIDQWLKSYWRSFSIIKQAYRKKIDIFHGLSNEIPFTLSKPIKSVVTIHDLIFKRYPEWYKPFDRVMYNWKFKSACQNADKIIAISEQTKSDIIEFYGTDASKIEVVYQTCNSAFKVKADTGLMAKVKEKYQLPEAFLLNVGTIEPRKNALNIVKALHQQKIDAPLYIIGRNTAYAESIKAYLSEHDLNQQVKILHEVSNEELPVFYQLAKTFIYPSTFEGFGIPIIEALYSGTPVITSEGGCFSEPGGPNSLYVEVGNIEALSAAISKVWKDEALAQIMSEKGLEYVQKFNTDKVIEDLYKVYQSLIDNVELINDKE